MDKIKFIAILLLSCLSLINVSAADKTTQVWSFLGKYGVEYQANQDYSKYVGKDVMYIREPTGDFPCPQNTILTIRKIDANDKKVSVSLVEKNGKNKYKMEASVGNRMNFMGTKFKEDFRLDGYKTLPLLLLDDFNKKKDELVGKTITGESGNQYQINDMSVNQSGFEVIYKYLKTGEIFKLHSLYFEGLNLIGKIYTNPKVRGFYEIVEIKDKINKKNYRDYTVGLRYSESNKSYTSIECLLSEATKCFDWMTNIRYTAHLSHVEKPENPDIRYGETINVDDSTVTKYQYKDNVVDLLIFAGEKNFNFILKNIYSSTIKLVWDEASFVDYDGETSKVMHKGVKYVEREASQPSSVIIKGAKLDDVIIPTKNIRYSNTLKDWETSNMLKNRGEIKLMIPIQIKDVINEYVLTFKVKKEYSTPSFIKEEYIKELEKENSVIK